MPQPQPQVTGARLLQVNTRLYSASRTDGHPWDDQRSPKPRAGSFPYRCEPFCQLLTDYTPSIVAVQECDQEDVAPGLLLHLSRQDGGDTWAKVMRGKVGLLYNAAKWKLLREAAFDMDNADDADRRVVVAQLQSAKTGGQLWVASTHFGVHHDQAVAERIDQAGTVVGVLKGLGVGAAPTVVAGDFNDEAPRSEPGVRRTFAGEGYRGIASKLDGQPIPGHGLKSHHGYKPTQPGRWIDDVLTNDAVRVVAAELVLTDPTSKYPNATDHNALFVRVSF